MSRPKQDRKICNPPLMQGFKPYGIARHNVSSVSLQYDEYESIRLLDYDGMNQDQAAEQMNVSRPTLTRIYEKARKIIAQALVEGKMIVIEGGNVQFEKQWFRCKRCFKLIDCLENHVRCKDCKTFCVDELTPINKQTTTLIQTNMNDNFKAKAAQWDSPDKIAMTQKFLSEMLLNVNPLSDWKAMEIGAGTGLVGLNVEPLVAKVVMVDTSESMLEVLKQKLASESKVEILNGEVFDYKQQDIDFVFSAMAFHHLTDVEKTLEHLATITKAGAWLVVGDLVTEDGSFHNFEPIPYCGFDTDILSKQFAKAGFEVKSVKIYNTITRFTDGKTTSYEQFMLIAKR